MKRDKNRHERNPTWGGHTHCQGKPESDLVSGIAGMAPLAGNVLAGGRLRGERNDGNRKGTT
eukprot:scaffold13326_cov127-Isochrysis_galbana.AAC.4